MTNTDPPDDDFDENPEWTEEMFEEAMYGCAGVDDLWRAGSVRTLRRMARALRRQADELDRQADLVADRPGARDAAMRQTEPDDTPHAAE